MKAKLNVVTDFLENEIGFKGAILENMKSVIVDDDGLEDFKNFIILNDGRFRSKVELSYMYIQKLKEESSYSKEQFVKDFNEDKQLALEKTVKSNVNSLVLKKVNDLLKCGLTVEILYDNLMKYNQFNPLQALQQIQKNFLVDIK